jgi:DNA-binding CsgD family transcriptional regulator
LSLRDLLIEIGNCGLQENSVKQALKQMFRKLEVSSRFEMVAKLAVILEAYNS